VVSESRVTWATSVPILVFQCLCVLEARCTRQTDRRQTKATLNASALWRRRHNNRRVQSRRSDPLQSFEGGGVQAWVPKNINILIV